MADKEALAALETAIQLEVEGHTYYVKTAAVVSWPEGSSTLLDLARDEMEHIRILKEEHAALMAGQEWLSPEKVSSKLTLGEKKPLPVFETSDAVIAGMVTERADALEVLEVAINAEYKSHTFYAEQAKKSESPAAGAIWNWLVKEEKTHQAILTDYALYIGAQKEWLLEHERPLLEG